MLAARCQGDPEEDRGRGHALRCAARRQRPAARGAGKCQGAVVVGATTQVGRPGSYVDPQVCNTMAGCFERFWEIILCNTGVLVDLNSYGNLQARLHIGSESGLKQALFESLQFPYPLILNPPKALSPRGQQDSTSDGVP